MADDNPISDDQVKEDVERLTIDPNKQRLPTPKGYARNAFGLVTALLGANAPAKPVTKKVRAERPIDSKAQLNHEGRRAFHEARRRGASRAAALEAGIAAHQGESNG